MAASLFTTEMFFLFGLWNFRTTAVAEAFMTQRKKYAALGQFVRVITPKEFVRCGYPLTIKIVMEQQFEEIEKDCARMFAALERKPAPVEEPQTSSVFGFSPAVLAIPGIQIMSATVHGMLCAAIAAYRLEQQCYGGNVRSIVEQNGPFEVGQLWMVTGKRLVKTGKRFPSRSYYSAYSGEYDYEPGGLENEQTHCVYSVQKGSLKSKILAANCELFSNGEKP
jgi:hypothetical protein